MTNKFLPRLAAIVFALFSAVLLLGTFLFINQAFAQETSPQGASTAKAQVRIAHLAPFTETLSATGVDVKLDGSQVLTDFRYLSSTTYIELPVGEYLVEVFPTGEMTPAISGTVDLAENEDYTAIAQGGANGYPLALTALLDDNDLPAAGYGKVRFGHLAPFAPVLTDTEAEIRTDGGALVAGPFRFGEIEATYLELAAGEYDLEVTTPGAADVLIDLAPFTLSGGDILYALAVGDGTNQATGVFAYPTDLEGFLLPTEHETSLRVAHLAPFDSDLADTAVDVKLDGTQVLTAFQYLSSTTYIDLPVGEHLVEVFPTGSVIPAISTMVDLAQNEDYTAIAQGGTRGYDLALATLL
ncbi:MAG TPA: DUF4397 domain-containing protein, partial [Anaerolineae bacterium]|nr:DUF4397 domain-containing protein [Anaerolineae bacterium]